MSEKRKILFIFFTFILLFSAVGFKAFWVQVLNREKLIAYSESQFVRTTKVYPSRGQIFDRNGEPLALNIRLYNLFSIPRKKGGDLKQIKELVRIVPDLNYTKMVSKLKGRDRFTWLARKVSLTKDQAELIKELKEIYIEEESSRFYPNHELAGQILGFVGIDNTGLSGVEYQFDKELRGNAKTIKYFKDAKGRPIKYETSEKSEVSKSIYLSIDKKLQAKAEKFLKEAIEKHNAESGGVAVMDAITGEILAMANYPVFDPNNLKSSKVDFRRISFVSDPFEPGSTFKVFTVASALENKIARSDSNFYCERGRLKIQGHVITEAESKKEFEWLSVAEILKYSSNIGTTKIAFDLTFPKLKSTLKKLNIGNKTDIELPGESRGIFTEDENISPLSLSNISFGQGVATTGIQMLTAFASIANGGYKVKPTIIKKEKAPVLTERIFSDDVVNQLNEMLIGAVENGTGTNAKIPLYKIAGKTSTAQKVSTTGGYSGYVSGFLGYPVGTDHKYVIYSYVDNPTIGGYYGNIVAAPVFRKLMEYLLYRDKSFETIASNDLAPDTYSVDKINFSQSSMKRFYGKGFVPNFIGLDKKSAQNLGDESTVLVEHKGFGVVTKQSMEIGVSVDSAKKVVLYYTPPEYE